MKLLGKMKHLYRQLYRYPTEVTYDSDWWYQELVSQYQTQSSWTKLRLKHIERLAQPMAGERVLDLGCASGAISHFCASRGAQVTGVDLSPLALEYAQELCQGLDCRFVVADVRRLESIADNSMDKAIAADLVEHLLDSDFRGMLEEAYRVLKPGGALILYTPNRAHFIERMKRRHLLLPPNRSHVAVRDLNTIVWAGVESGFYIDQAYTVESHLPALSSVERLFQNNPVLGPFLGYRICVKLKKPAPKKPPATAGEESTAFYLRNGIARRSDLLQPCLRDLLLCCEHENRAFSKEAKLPWSRQWEYPYVLAHLPENGEGKKLLDAGCGFGFLPILLAQRSFTVHACDRKRSIGPRLNRIASKRNLSIRFSAEDLADLGYPSESFDFITCVSVLEHTNDQASIIKEFHRLLKPSGKLLLTFDLSCDGQRKLSPALANSLIRMLESEFEPQAPFFDWRWLEKQPLPASNELLTTDDFRNRNSQQLPWKVISKTALHNLMRGKVGRPFYSITVIGLALKKK